MIRKTFEINFFGAFAVTKALLPLIRKAEAGRIVNVSSGLGSLTNLSNPASDFHSFNSLAYCASKAALNTMTVTLARELRATPVKVNSAAPGYTATALNNFAGTQTPEQAAPVIVRLATLPAEGPTGGFFNKDGPLPW